MHLELFFAYKTYSILRIKNTKINNENEIFTNIMHFTMYLLTGFIYDMKSSLNLSWQRISSLHQKVSRRTFYIDDIGEMDKEASKVGHN